MNKGFILSIISIFIFFSTIFAASIWRDDFNNVNNWYDNKTDLSFGADIYIGKKRGKAVIKQNGKNNWGKAAFVVKNIDIDKYDLLRIKVNKVDKAGDYKVFISSVNWNKSYEIIDIDKGMGKGIHEGDIKKATGWKGKKTFNIVLIVEGMDKKIILDWIEISESINE